MQKTEVGLLPETYAKINSKLNIDLNLKSKKIKLLKQNIR